MSIQTVLTTTGHDILTVAAGWPPAPPWWHGGFVAAVGRRTRPGLRIVDTATVPVAVAAVLAVILIAGPGGPAIVTLVAATTFIRFVSRTRDVVAESLSRPPVQALFVSGAPDSLDHPPARAADRRPATARDVLGSVSIGCSWRSPQVTPDSIRRVSVAAGHRTADGDALIPVLAPYWWR